MKLADYKSPIVKEKALALTRNQKTIQDKITAIFLYVRDDIKLQFPDEGDLIKASQTIKYGYGQCNNKANLFLALLKSIGIEARSHFSLIRKEIQQGLITGILYRKIPEYLSHCWIEVKIGDKWIRIDSYINDKEYYEVGKKKLRDRGWNTGYSIACSKNKSSIELDFDNEQFVQMDAVTDDHGVYDDPGDYYSSSKYKNRPNALTLFIYSLLIKKVNKKIVKMRYSYQPA